MRTLLLRLRERKWLVVLTATILPALLAGLFEYFMSSGISGWVPLWAGLASGVLTAAVLVFLQLQGSKPADRVFLQRTANELVEQVRGLTDMAAKPIIRRHVGTWLPVQVRVDNVSERFGKVIVTDAVSYTQPGVILSFNKKNWINKLRILDQGDTLLAIGRISDVSDDIICLENCEVVDSNDPT